MNKFNISCIESNFEPPRNLSATFKLGPFDKNYTITIANNLRRALLSELGGVAITGVKIYGVDHEYTNLKGVRESVLDILLNIKQIVLISAFQLISPTIAVVYISGPGIVKAGNIFFPSYIKCIDPEQPIATLCPDGSLIMSLILSPGKHYWMQSGGEEFRSYCLSILPNLELSKEKKQWIHFLEVEKTNLLAIDAVFMPIQRVNYWIEVDEDFVSEKPSEYVFFEIWTNGSIHPVSAIQLAGRSLVDIFNHFENFSCSLKPRFLYPKGRLKKKDKVQKKESVHVMNPGEQKQNSLLNLDIANLDLSLRAYTCLKKADIQDIRDLLKRTREDLLLLKNFGKRSLEEVEKSLYILGFFLPEERMKSDDFFITFPYNQKSTTKKSTLIQIQDKKIKQNKPK
jgi:DNA-directed RNA polymerase subunit alpha